MKRAALVSLQLALAILVGLGARELWRAHSSDGSREPGSVETIGVSGHITPSVHTFGEPIVATVEAVADAALVKPSTIRVDTDFAPYELAGEPTVEREVASGVARVVFRFPLRCLSEGCDAAAERGVAQFESGFVRYRFVRGSGPGRDLIDWAPIEVASRVSETEVSTIRWRASQSALPEATMRFGAVGLAVVLLAVAAALAGAALWLALRLWRVEKEAEIAPEDTRTPLERALDLVLVSSQNGAAPPARRQTLERLARELNAVGLASLAEDARALAWSPHLSSGDEVASLVRRATDAASRRTA